jgi:hypothetical protein
MTVERMVNGVVYQFPDGTSEAVLDRFVAQKTNRAPAAQTAPKSNVEPVFTGAGGAALQGLTMGFSDEAIAKARSMFGKGSYEDYARAEREAQRKYGEEHPVANFAAEVGGGLIPAIVTGGASMIPSAGRTVAKTVAPSVLKMLGIGAGTGAVSAVGTTEKTAEEWGGEAVRGAVAGAATTGVLGLAGKYIVMPGYRALKSALGFGDANKMADLQIVKALAKDGMTPQQALDAVRAASRGEMTLADMGENTAALLRRSTSEPGPARVAAKSELQSREAGRVNRVDSDLVQLMSGSNDFYTDVMALAAKRSKDADVLYKAAWDSNAVITPKTAGEIARMQNFPSFAEALKAGSRRMQDMGLDIADPKNVLRGLHETKIALDDMIGKAVRAGEGGQAKTLMDMKRQLLSDMEKASPEYRTARQAYAGDSEMMTAMEQGKDIYKMPEIDMRKMIDRFKNSPSEYDAFRAGIAQAALEKLRTAAPGSDPLKTVLGRDAEQKLRRAFRDDNAFDTFVARLQEESKMLGTEKTAIRRTPIDADLGDNTAVGAAMNLATGNPMGAALEAARAALPAGRITPQVNAGVTQKLLTPQSGLDPVQESILSSLKAQEAALVNATAVTNTGAAAVGAGAAARSPKNQQPYEAPPEGQPVAPAPFLQ